MIDYIKKFREVIAYTALVVSFTLGAPTYFLTQAAFAKEKADLTKSINILDHKLQLADVKSKLEKLHKIPKEGRPDWVEREIKDQEEIKSLLIKTIHGS